MNNEAAELLITNIKLGVKNPNRVNVFVNRKYSFSLDVAQLVDFKLKVGLKITSEKLLELKTASEFGKLYQRTLEWVLMRPRSVRETRDYLARKLKMSMRKNSKISSSGTFEGDHSFVTSAFQGSTRSDSRFSEEAFYTSRDAIENYAEKISELQNQIIERLKVKKYLDDKRFAEYYVENRFVKKGVSKKRLKMELMKKGISSEIIEQVLNKRNDEEEIKKIIARKSGKYDNKKLVSYLCRQGFDYQLVQSLVENRETD